jgi:predicted kinase
MSARSTEQAIARILELTGRPDKTNERPCLVLTVGLPASGKSTFCRALARATGVKILESDALRAALFQPVTHDSDESRQLFDALYGATRALLREGASVIVDATNLRERDRGQAYAAASETGASLLVLHFRAPERVIAARLAQRRDGADPDDRSQAGMAVYRKLAETEEPIRCEHRKVDTSDAAAVKAALDDVIQILEPRRETASRPNTGGSSS